MNVPLGIACLALRSEVGRQVAPSLFGDDVRYHALLALLPLVVLAAVALAIHLGFPRAGGTR
jgi:hypothetical protein